MRMARPTIAQAHVALLTGGAVTYTIKYSTQPGEVNTLPEGALEVKGISGTSTILTALERSTRHYVVIERVRKPMCATFLTPFLLK